MHGKLFCNIPTLKCRKPILLLVICWICSIVAGAYLAFCLQDISLSLMHAVVADRVSIVGLAMIVFPPFILSAAAVYFSLPKFMYVILALKGIAIGFNTYTLLACYTDAAWLIYCLVFFSNTFTLIPLFLLVIKHLMESGKSIWCDTCRCLIYAFVIGVIDYLFISPLISNVIYSL